MSAGPLISHMFAAWRRPKRWDREDRESLCRMITGGAHTVAHPDRPGRCGYCDQKLP